ncbi:hypothetical protein [Borrelia venezuelensis]|uniref:hypothetical protein n=1 Tax=Borrelia venezuelensis TaxID=1653839 RepID=UPI001FF64387|nr:hypothetical protein [Borrelia venezuelensis]UPA12593.1 hypothetical protein bvRMA01_000924 [Borrelia venezuelensis]
MRYVKVVTSIVVLLLIINCKLDNKRLKAESETKLAQENAKSVAKSITGHVSKLTGLTVTEIKALSEKELAKIAAEAKVNSEDSKKEINNFRIIKNKAKLEVNDIPNPVKAIKNAAEKIETAFKALLNAGYNGPVANVIKSNIDSGVKMISLLDKLLDIATKGINNTRELDINKVIEEFNTQNPALRIYINESGVNDIMRSCIKIIMTNISRYFFNGVHNELRDNLDKAPSKLKEALTSLKEAASSINTAAGIIELCFNSNY